MIVLLLPCWMPRSGSERALTLWRSSKGLLVRLALLVLLGRLELMASRVLLALLVLLVHLEALVLVARKDL